jgi:hypothetical protein
VAKISGRSTLSDIADAGKTQGRQLITEIPDTLCKGAKKSGHKDKRAPARSDFTTARGLPTWATRANRAGKNALSGVATLKGVRFLDLPHSSPQTEVSLDDIELHQALKFDSVRSTVVG